MLIDGQLAAAELPAIRPAGATPVWAAALESPSRREWVEQGRMWGLFSAELESQSGSERVEARSAQTPEFRLFESACFPDYPSSDLSQTRLAKVMHCMHHHAK